MKPQLPKPTGAFVGASWTALLAGSISFLSVLWNVSMYCYEKVFYFATLVFGRFVAVSRCLATPLDAVAFDVRQHERRPLLRVLSLDQRDSAGNMETNRADGSIMNMAKSIAGGEN